MKPLQRLAVNLVSAAALGLLVVAMAWAADDTAVNRYKEHRAAFEREKARKVAAAEAGHLKAKSELAAYEAGVVRKVRTVQPPNDRRKQYYFPSLATKESYVATAQRAVDAAQKMLDKAKGESYAPPRLSAVPKKGDVFWLEGVNVIQVIDPDAMLVRDYVSEGGGVAVSGGQVIRERVTTHEVWMMMRGVPTDGVADDSGYNPKRLFEATGTESFTTVAGAKKTVITVRPFDEKKGD
jgi:hypothetical protein